MSKICPKKIKILCLKIHKCEALIIKVTLKELFEMKNVKSKEKFEFKKGVIFPD